MTVDEEWLRADQALSLVMTVHDEYSARMSICKRAHAGLVRARAKQFHSKKSVERDCEVQKEFWWAEGATALVQDWVTGDFSTWIDQRFEVKAFGVEFAWADILEILPRDVATLPDGQSENLGAGELTSEDWELVEKLAMLVPSAALSYQQAILDLNQTGRISFRGPASELREALREILDHLAPDSEVMTAPGYSQETGVRGPTMKQKARFILKARGAKSTSDAPEQAVTAFEEAIAALARATYQLSSKATHRAGERAAVLQIRRYLVAIFHDILP